ncbi:unnamed protein product [Ixodes persulcatus]
MPTIGADRAFMATTPGLLRIGEIILGLCGLVSVESLGGDCYLAYIHRYELSLFVVISSFIFAFFIVMVFVLRAQEALARCFNLPLSLLVSDSFIALFYLIVCLLEFTAYCPDPDDNASTKVAGVFGMFSMMCFVVSSYFSYKMFQEERLPTAPPPGLRSVVPVSK